MNLELQSHISLKVGCRAILQTKPCTSPNLSRLNKSLIKRCLEWATIELLQPREFVLFFATMHHKANLSQYNKRKIFSFLTLPNWRRSSQWPVTRTLVSAEASVASFSRLRCSLSSGLHCIGWRSISVNYLTIRLTIQTALFLPLFLGLLSVFTCMTVHVHVYYNVQL